MTTWLYIAGRGHSGSTMFDAMLGNADQIESVGELVSGMGRYKGVCSCGKLFLDCPFWVDVRQRYKDLAGIGWDEAVLSTVGQAHIRRFCTTLVSSANASRAIRLKKDCEYIAQAVRDVSGKKTIVDSSKEITRALFLMRFVPGAKVIHLVRHPEKVLQSHYHRLEKGSGFKFLRMTFKPRRWFAPFLFLSAVGWTVGNMLAEVVRLFGRDRFLRVRYEDLVTSPVEELERVEKFADVSLEKVITQVKESKPFDVGHNIGGNHMRMAGTFTLDPSKADRNSLPKYYRIMVNVLCWPMLWRYGYLHKKK